MQKTKASKSALSIPVMFQKTEELAYDDGRFTKVKIWLMHLGENANGSVFEKEVVDAAFPTLGYIPIVGFVENNDSGEKDFSDHRYIITKDEKGIRRKYLGIPYGVVLSNADNNAHYEDRICDDGITRTFVVVDGFIWNMFEDGSDIINRDLIKSHSMELYQDTDDAYDGYEDENGIFHFTKFSFRAACILGNDYEPAMTNSTVEVQFTMTDFVKNLQSELNNKYTVFTKLVSKKFNQGGNKNMPKSDFAQTVMNQFNDISNIVRNHEMYRDRWGDNCPRYYLCDIQEDEVIVIDTKENYNYFGFKFTVDGDKPEIDFSNGIRKKICYEDYKEGATKHEGAFDFGKHIEEIEEIAYTKVTEANEKVTTVEGEKAEAEANYENIKADYDKIKPEYDNYVLAEETRKAEELAAQKDAKFAEYEDSLAENADFVALKTKKDELSVDEIDKECAVLYVRANKSKVNFGKSGSSPATVGIMNDSDNNEGYIQTKYGNIPVNR